MGYVYDEVKNQLEMDQKGSKNTWSPNIYRCIIIGADYLFFAYHGGYKMNKIVPLNAENVVGDIRKSAEGKYRGSINNLLQERQLSCLEEIYLDVAFQRFPNIFDVKKYADSVKSNVSRLRYIGYCQTSGDTNWLISAYTKENPIYTLAEDKTQKGLKLHPIKVDNEQWYKKYFLRPQYYSADKDNGKIAVWFKKNEKLIEGMLAEAERAKLEQDNMKKLREIVAIDEENATYLLQLSRVLNAIEHPDKIGGVITNKKDLKILKDAIKETKAEREPIKGLSESTFNKLYMQDKTIVVPLGRFFKVFDKESNAGKFDKKQILEMYKKRTGFFNLYDILDSICYHAFKIYYTQDNYGSRASIAGLMLGTYGDKIDTVPAGKFRDLIAEKMGNPNLKNSSAQVVKGFFLYITFLLGTRKFYEEL